MHQSSRVAVRTDALSIDDMPQLLVGAGTVVPTLHGTKRYINFDNAASTPTFQPIKEGVNDFLQWYSNVHRGTGFKSQLSSWAYEESRDIVAEFVNADLTKHVVLFTKNTTEAINKLSHRIALSAGDVVRRRSATSLTVAPPAAKPVEVFTKSAPPFSASRHPSTFSLSLSRAVSGSP